ncbi:site-specific recombinase XerD [Anaerospora hongkongensis]|uniref:Site-specific recombinase XerD n=1 Tax=Anaerospora hongkongensis TaxID=244830 RepID=A0A4R1Q2I0_9FIRM|nr:tyrosine-type recombinase/integrase [Anaerospora hongkongensis]TCL39429.1 site-specific recombinase XerD [Anaerospora hongkongensis]
MYLYRKYENGKTTAALFDDNMVLIKPVYYYFKKLQLEDKAPLTIFNYALDLKEYFQFLNRRHINYEFSTPETIEDFVSYLKGVDTQTGGNLKVRSNKTIKRMLAAIRDFYEHEALHRNFKNPIIMEDDTRKPGMYKPILAHVNSLISRSAFRIKTSSNGPETWRILDDDETELITNTLNNKRDKLIFKLLYFTGMRISELLGLCTEDIPYPNAMDPITSFELVPRDENDLDRQHKSGPRTIYLPTSVAIELDNYIVEERDKFNVKHSYIFVSYQKQHLGKPLSQAAISDCFRRVGKMCNISFTPHDLRHTCCTNYVQLGLNLKIVQEIMGHKQYSTTEKYTHLTDKYVNRKISDFWMSNAERVNRIGGI